MGFRGASTSISGCLESRLCQPVVPLAERSECCDKYFDLDVKEMEDSETRIPK